MYFLDTETCGFTGPVITIQTGDEELIETHHVWLEPIKDTLDIIEALLEDTIVCYNVTYDSFHIHKLYNILRHCKDKDKPPNIEEFRKIELSKPWKHSYCLRPKNCLDIFLLLKTHVYPYLSDRKQIVIKDIPTASSEQIKVFLEEFTAKHIPPLMFGKYKGKHPGDYWEIKPNSEFKHLVDLQLKFSPTTKLKALTEHHFKIKTIEFPTLPQFEEFLYFPYIGDWTKVINYHINFWATNKQAQLYASNDIKYLQMWFKELKLTDDYNDINSVLAWAVGGIRFHGLNIDLKKAQELQNDISSKKIPTAPADALNYIRSEISNPLMKAAITNTNKFTLEKLIRLGNKQAEEVFDARREEKLQELIQKLVFAERFFPSFNVIGTQSNRMSGSDKLNPQGISRKVRELFTFADTDEDFVTCGGDFDSQEVTIVDAVYNDPTLRTELKSGKKLHRILASILFDKKYDEVNDDEYWRGKQSVFAFIYGCHHHKFAQTANITLEKAELVYGELKKKFPELIKGREKQFKAFCSMTQPGGLKSKVIWAEPERYATSLFGFKRDFIIRNLFTKLFFQLGENFPIKDKTEITRKGRIQTVTGASKTALFAAAFSLQNANMRAASNHEIQATGASATKLIQYAIYTNHQPIGIQPFNILFMNIHDEIISVVKNNIVEDVNITVNNTVEKIRQVIPLIKLIWKTNLKSWKDKS